MKEWIDQLEAKSGPEVRRPGAIMLTCAACGADGLLEHASCVTVIRCACGAVTTVDTTGNHR